MPESSPTPVPSLRPGWTAIVGRITRDETRILALYPTQTSNAATPPEAA